ncbi:2-oxo acid dehydrogenase subunit E2 [Segetibacter sp. 3557_3]|uniref:dihydrolipoamide acetyltransferase family protein n=1 Tax=Segetibacter sp. 3557_3 TaxID=2547429 RepID=UPI001058D741|nr:dihydrolipoamide acetyltransferase family protein [Segetibacter sp. 3557_3]TDH29219.1 2-oxo acid dehydrogenase subunit E2 [Segetibacter sp. 3557_3]
MATVDLIMPKLGESITEATVLKWHKKPGDRVELDETVLDIATDKVDSEVPSTAEGRIAEILYDVNDVVPIGKVIARIETDVNATLGNQPTPTPAATQTQAPAQVESEPTTDAIPFVPHSPGSAAPIAGTNRFYSPLVLNIANSEGIALSELEHMAGSGADGRVTKKDILLYLENKRTGRPIPMRGQEKAPEKSSKDQEVDLPQQKPAPENKAVETAASLDEIPVEKSKIAEAPDRTNVAPQPVQGNVEIIEMDRMRKLIAKHMVDSKHTSPHVTSFSEADVTNMVMWREKVKKDFEHREGTKITFTPMFIECVAKVIKQFPFVNCSVDGERIILKKDINIGMATALPSGNLIVPIIKNADHLNLVGLSKSVNSLADNARKNALKSDDISGGTFTITNVGTFGSLMGTPIINQPQVAILAVGAIKKRPVVIETTDGDAIGIRHMMYLSLSYDHRVVDGSVGASFLTAVAKEFENWDVNRKT